jgi:tripartite-type tricarboxylate transporter receptor subunit TctC
MILRWAAIIAAILWPPLQPAALGQNFPAKPIRMIIAESSGSGADILARQIGGKLTQAWGQSVVVDSRTGASGLIAAELVARSAPDGYTIWMATMTQLISTTMYQRFMMADEFMPIGMVASTYFVIAANAAAPVHSIAELIAYAKARPGQILYGSTGQGSSTHLCMELFRTMTGIELVHVPYKSAAMRLADLAGGQLQVSCAVAPSLQAFVKSGRVRALGVTAAQRTLLVPGVPSIAESVPGYEIVGWYGLLAPLGTPKAIVAQINSMVVKVLQTAEVQDRLIALGAEAAGSTPAEFGAFLRNQTSKWAKVLRESNIRPTE